MFEKCMKNDFYGTMKNECTWKLNSEMFSVNILPCR